MTIEQMTPEEEVRLRLAAGISPSTPTEYMLKHIPLWVKMSILRRNSGAGGGGTTESVTTYDFTTNTYRKNGGTVSLGDVSEFIRLSSATKWHDEQLVEVQSNIPRISDEGLLVEEQRSNLLRDSAGGFTGNYGSIAAEPIHKGLPWHSFEADEGSTHHGFTHPVSGLPLSKTLTFSVFIRRGARRYIYVRGTGVLREAGCGVDFDLGEVVKASSSIISYNLKRLDSGTFQLSYTVVSDDSRDGGQIYLFFSDMGSYSAGSNPIYVGDGQVCGYVGTVQVEEGSFPTSYIPTEDTPATRSPDILNIPLLPTQTVTGDWDAGVTYSVAGGIATFTGHGYIRNITVEAL